MKPSPIKEKIAFEDFEKLDIRVGTIISVSEAEKSNLDSFEDYLWSIQQI